MRKSIHFILSAIVLTLLCGCRILKTEKSQEQDSVRIEYREKIVKVPVTVYVKVPVEQKEKMTKDSTSHLETSFAISDAFIIWIDGVPFLRHSLENKPQTIQKNDSVPVIHKDRVEWKTRRVFYTKTEIREKQLTLWQKIKINCGGYALIVLALIIIVKSKKLVKVLAGSLS